MSKYQSTKKLTTVRLDPADYADIERLALKQNITPSEALRQAVRYGLTNLIDGRDEDELLRRRLKEKKSDIDGQTFINALKKELKI